ncbi:hypothetical protein PMAA_043250 [Talaromyces marneffei ATCC 18224]|uniref:Uncharacterized protein n=1 Tax=Talaromyces marneffei (strain ATCC 18224 / CBS 334.59 / QM 7333) TaxID=441960 RepID=B6QR73_TALMQ|nr:hypothetical protein PMAA_043250 [Talaromyces marneffei ATCC 18224]
MRYYSFFICLVAVSLCFTPHRRNDESQPSQEQPLIDTNDVRMNQVHGNRDRLIEDIRICGQFLNALNALSGEFNNDTISLGFVKACERVVVILDQTAYGSLQSHIQSHDRRYLQGSTRRDRQYLEESEIPGTTSSALDANTSERIFLDKTEHHSERKYRREEICEDKVCEAERLDEICNAENIDPSVAQTCKMCYPVRNAPLINAHCQAKWRRERKAFYVISFVLIAVTLVSGLILYIRRRYLRVKNPHPDELIESGINPPGELYYYDGPRSFIPSERGSSLTVNCSPEPRLQETSKRYHNSWDDEDEGDVISTSFAQRRLRQLGVLSKTGRKRIHDLFDLEALQSRRGTGKDPRRHSDQDRVPVMPWAPNATAASKALSLLGRRIFMERNQQSSLKDSISLATNGASQVHNPQQVNRHRRLHTSLLIRQAKRMH